MCDHLPANAITDHSTPTPPTPRHAEIARVLNQDMDKAIQALTRLRADNGSEFVEVDWPCGLMLRVTRHQATIFITDPDDQILDLLVVSGRSFCVHDPITRETH